MYNNGEFSSLTVRNAIECNENIHICTVLCAIPELEVHYRSQVLLDW